MIKFNCSFKVSVILKVFGLLHFGYGASGWIVCLLVVPVKIMGDKLLRQDKASREINGKTFNNSAYLCMPFKFFASRKRLEKL